jgi:hypothetical protein
MKAALVFIGEAFRGGGYMKSGQMCRTRGHPDSYSEQKIACESHIQFIKKLEKKWKVDVYIDTYSTQFNFKINSWYQDNLVMSKFHEGPPIGYTNIYKDSINLIGDRLDTYDFVHFFRIDMILKKQFWIEFQFSNKIRYPFRVDAGKYDTVWWWLNAPRLADTMLFVPNSEFKLLKEKVPLLDDVWVWGLIQQLKLQNRVDVYIRTIHDSDPKKDWNPLYSFANRMTTSEHTFEGFYVPQGQLTKVESSF